MFTSLYNKVWVIKVDVYFFQEQGTKISNIQVIAKLCNIEAECFRAKLTSMISSALALIMLSVKR